MEERKYCCNCEEYVETHEIERYETYIVKKTDEITLLCKVRVCNKCGGSIFGKEPDLKPDYAELVELLRPFMEEYDRRHGLR